MNGEERREKIIKMLTTGTKPIPGVALAKQFDVSRQVIVQDIALLRANGMNIFSTNRGYLIQKDSVARYMEEIATGKSSLLKNVTSGFHYHTILADSEEILDIIQEELGKQGFLAKLQDYEPVDFWKKEEA